jgi:integrase
MNSLDRFKAEYQDYNGLTICRCREQGKALAHLCQFVGVSDPLDCTGDGYKRWLFSLNESNLAPITVRKYGMLVRPFFGWAFDAGLYSSDEYLTIKRAKFPDIKKRLPRPYSSKEIKKLWPAIAKQYPSDSDGKWRARFKRGTSAYKRIEPHAHRLQLTAVARIALDCGLRRSEIFDLSLDDMHYDNAYIVVREGKGEKFREVPYTKAARAAVKDWIEFRTELKPKHDRPWLSLTRIGPEGVWLRPMDFRRFSMYLRDAGDFTLHRMRHTCATNWLRAGMPIERVSRLLGHANISETQGYAELVVDDVQRDVERYEDQFESQVA